MQRRATMGGSSGSSPRATMNASLALLVCAVLGSAVGYSLGAAEPYSVAGSADYGREPSQRLFWGTQGSNQVGGTGLWASLTNKFPFLGNMFGRMELPTEYGVPNQYDVPQQFAAPDRYEWSPQYGAPGYPQPPPQFYRQPSLVPSGRDVGLTDDAVIVTPPFVPIAQPAPGPAPAPAPAPIAPRPPSGYHYDKPQYRLEYPHK